ncbi:MAG TPA: response regulator [Chloroflexota bacterium]
MAREAANVVVLDDEPDLRELMCALLEDEGYHVISLGHPREAEDLENKEPEPDLFVLDLMLPEMTGIQLARVLRRDGFPHTPMIAMSASTGMLRAAKESQLFEESLPKPFELSMLLDKVERLVRT